MTDVLRLENEFVEITSPVAQTHFGAVKGVLLSKLRDKTVTPWFMFKRDAERGITLVSVFTGEEIVVSTPPHFRIPPGQWRYAD